MAIALLGAAGPWGLLAWEGSRIPAAPWAGVWVSRLAWPPRPGGRWDSFSYGSGVLCPAWLCPPAMWQHPPHGDHPGVPARLRGAAGVPASVPPCSPDSFWTRNSFETDSDLPAGWMRVQDTSGTYYWHIPTGTTQWEPPAGLARGSQGSTPCEEQPVSRGTQAVGLPHGICPEPSALPTARLDGLRSD